MTADRSKLTLAQRIKLVTDRLKKTIAGIRQRLAGPDKAKQRHAAVKVAKKDSEARIAELRRRYGSSDQVSDLGVGFTAAFEGFPPTQPYNDPVGYCTVGYGHLLHYSACSSADRSKWQGITPVEASKLLKQDLQVFAAVVADAVTTNLTQPQFDACIDFAFNCGEGAFRSSTLLKYINARQFSKVRPELMTWVHAGGQVLPGLVRRRASEADLFEKGDYSPRS